MNKLQKLYLTLFFMSICPFLLQAQIATGKFGGLKATAGGGLYKDKIIWLNWDIGKLTTNTFPTSTTFASYPNLEGVYTEFKSSSGVTYRATLTNIQLRQVKVGHRPDLTGFKSSLLGDWGGNNFPTAYNSFKRSNDISYPTQILSLEADRCALRVFNVEAKFRVSVQAIYPDGKKMRKQLLF